MTTTTGSRPRTPAALAVALAGALAAAGCAGDATGPAAAAPGPLTSADYADVQRRIGASPEFRRDLVLACAAKVRAKPPRERAALAAFLAVGPAEVDQAFCSRVTDAVGRGEIAYRDFMAVHASPIDPGAMRRVLRALRPRPDEIMV